MKLLLTRAPNSSYNCDHYRPHDNFICDDFIKLMINVDQFNLPRKIEFEVLFVKPRHAYLYRRIVIRRVEKNNNLWGWRSDASNGMYQYLYPALSDYINGVTADPSLYMRVVWVKCTAVTETCDLQN